MPAWVDAILVACGVLPVLAYLGLCGAFGKRFARWISR